MLGNLRKRPYTLYVSFTNFRETDKNKRKLKEEENDNNNKK